MTYKQLVKAYYSAVEGPRAPILIAVNLYYLEDWIDILLASPLGLVVDKEEKMAIKKLISETRKRRSGLFHGAVMVFRSAVPDGVIWFWYADAKVKEIKI